MLLPAWLRRRPRPNRRPSAWRPRFDPLEGRTVPSQISLTVSSLADSGPGSLRAAILAADAGKHSDKFTIGFAVNGTIDLRTPLPDLNNPIAIRGPGAGALTVERAPGASFSSAILTVDAGQSASLSGLTIANGDSGGIFSDGTLAVAGCTITGNSGAGGIGVSNGTLNLTASTVANNPGGGVFGVGDVAISGCTVTGNSVGMALSGGTLTADGTTFSTNHGWAVSAYLSFASTIRGCTFTGDAGGIFQQGAPLTVSDSAFTGNSARNGGAILNVSTMTVARCTFTDNSATGFDFGGRHYPGRGGAIDNVGAMTVRDSTFAGNAAELGGAIYNDVAFSGSSIAYGTLNVMGGTFIGDTASDSGGAIDNNGTATLSGCTLSGNSAGTAGGGVANALVAALTVNDSTILSNVAPIGADLDNLGSATLNDSTVGVIGH